MGKRIIEKLDKIEATLTSQEVNLGKLTVSVEEHVRRSNMLEEAMKPVQRHVSMVEGALKLVALIGLLATIVEAIHMLFK